jgi:hypothetical protein
VKRKKGQVNTIDWCSLGWRIAKSKDGLGLEKGTVIGGCECILKQGDGLLCDISGFPLLEDKGLALLWLLLRDRFTTSPAVSPPQPRDHHD